MYIAVRDLGEDDGGLPSSRQLQETGGSSLTVATIVKRGLVLLAIAALAYFAWKMLQKRRSRRRRKSR